MNRLNYDGHCELLLAGVSMACLKNYITPGRAGRISTTAGASLPHYRTLDNEGQSTTRGVRTTPRWACATAAYTGRSARQLTASTPGRAARSPDTDGFARDQQRFGIKHNSLRRQDAGYSAHRPLVTAGGITYVTLDVAHFAQPIRRTFAASSLAGSPLTSWTLSVGRFLLTFLRHPVPGRVDASRPSPDSLRGGPLGPPG